MFNFVQGQGNSKILTTEYILVFRGLKFESNARLGKRGRFQRLVIWILRNHAMIEVRFHGRGGHGCL